MTTFGQAVRYAVVGLAAAAIYVSITWLLVTHLSIPRTVAIFFGYGTGTAFNYFVNYYWSFASASPHQRAAFRYGIIVIAGLIWNTLVVELSMFIGVPLTLALLFGAFSWPLLSFVALRFWALPPSPAG